MSQTLLWPLAVFLPCNAIACSKPADAKEQATSASTAQVRAPTIPPAPSTFPSGFFTGAAAVVPLPAEGEREVHGVIFANGMDWSPQPLVMYEVGLKPGNFDNRPRWVSEKSGYYSGVCSGDLDGKNGPDLVVTALQDVYGAFGSESRNSSVEMYLSTGEGDRRKTFGEPIRVATSFRASSCSVADLDGDGLSEILVGGLGPRGAARLLQRKRVEEPFTEKRLFGAPGVPACEGGDDSALEPAEVKIADVNGDKRPDLLLAGKHLAIYYAAETSAIDKRYSERASWCSDEEIGYSPSIDVAPASDPKHTLVTVSKSCVSLRNCPRGAWLVYDTQRSSKALWRRDVPEGAVAGPAVITSMRQATGDEIPDLVASVLYDPSQPKCFGSSLRIYAGQALAPHELAVEPIVWRPEYEPVATKLLPINLYKEPCGDLLVLSAHPLTPSALFEEVGSCTPQ